MWVLLGFCIFSMEKRGILYVKAFLRKFNKEVSINKIMEEEYRRDVNFEQAYEDLGEEDKKELEEIGKELEKYKENLNFPIKDKNLKKRIAKICLKLIKEAPNDKTFIMEISYIITGSFIWYTYEDKLDEAMDIAGELELPEEHISGDIFQMWKNMKKKFQQYLEE